MSGAASLIVNLEDLPARLEGGPRLLGLDVGTKTIGLALSDVERRLASPLETIRRRKFAIDAARIVELAREHGAGGLILGLPLNMDGSAGPRAQSVHAFARNLGGVCPLPLSFWDERLSTAAVTRLMIEQDVTRARRAQAVDRLAAAYILQGALDRLQRLARPGGAAT